MDSPQEFHRLDVFYHTAKNGSFTRAAEALNISGSMVSQHINKLEKQLDVKLFMRSTRMVRLTEPGRLLYQASVDIFERLEVARSDIDEVKNEPRGIINISTQSNFANSFLIPMLNQFTRRYPAVGFNLNVDDQVQDLKQQSIDVSFTVGEIENSDYYAVKLKEIEIIICTAPEYLEQINLPTTLNEIKLLDCVVLNTLKDKNVWSFVNPSGEIESIYLSPVIQTNSGMSLVKLVTSGTGIAILPDFFVRKELQSGALVQLLTDYNSTKMGVYAVYHQQLHKSSYTIRSFIEFIKTAMQDN